MPAWERPKSPTRVSAVVAALALQVLLHAAPARAELDANTLAQALRASHPNGERLPAWFALPKTGRVPVLVQLPIGADARARGLVPIARGFAVAEPRLSDLALLGARNTDARITWAPPRRPLLDKALGWIRADTFRERTSGTGKGVVVGIVDTGLDLFHRDMRGADGKTRVRWLMDVSRSAIGKHPELESEYGCSGDTPCAIYDNDDLDAVMSDDVIGNEPRDDEGHGTHVTSLAAGNGLSQSPPKYPGVAPEATLIIARAARGDGKITDPDILRATRFVFDQAAKLGMPAVVNLSLGSDYGGHDGTSALERALAEFVGDSEPGRAIVVAAGNSAGLLNLSRSPYPNPRGIHTELHVPPDSPARVPLLVPTYDKPSDESAARSTVWVWINSRPSDRLKIGIADQSGHMLVEPVAPGSYAGVKKGKLNLTILNRARQNGGDIDPGETGAVVVLDGILEPASVFALRFEGNGSPELWVESDGALGPESGNEGVLFPRASKAGTINVPASHPELIAVGATLNRLDWVSYAGGHVHQDSFGSLEKPPLDTLAYFSAAGPTASGWMKPDIVAPGAFVIGAMASNTDPRDNGGAGIFTQVVRCPDQDATCAVTDDFHAVLSGTSMSAPIVSGAIALLLEQDPTLDSTELLSLLQAGARRPEGTVLYEQQVGPGALDVDGALSVLLSEQNPIRREPASEQSWISLADDYAHPDRQWPLTGLVELRDASGNVADGFGPARLALAVSPREAGARFSRLAPGMWQFSVVVPEATGGQTLSLEVRLDGALFLRRTVPIAVDRNVAAEGGSARGGCALAPSSAYGFPRQMLALFGLASLAGLCCARRRAHSLAR